VQGESEEREQLVTSAANCGNWMALINDPALVVPYSEGWVECVFVCERVCVCAYVCVCVRTCVYA
jgi:hypothetical protein